MRRSCILGLPRFRAVEVWWYHGRSPRSRKSASRYACTGRDTRTRGTKRLRRSRQRRRRWLPAFEELAIRLSSPRAMTRSASLTARRGSCSLLCTKSDPERRQVNEMTVGYERPSGDLGANSRHVWPRPGAANWVRGASSTCRTNVSATVFVPGCAVDDETSGRGLDRRSIASSA